MKRDEFWAEIQSMSVDDLRAKERELREEALKLRFQKAINPLDQTHLLKVLQRNVARVKTRLSTLRKEATVGAAE